ncbi:MAG: sulfatase-like hydrolase/transferase, partial [candidate division Zixibacteria bacterium]|nr:sulfatase-like hydrolase/transferase [candidate division Zixibacteria bacterium]
QDLAENGYRCVSIGKMHFSPRDVPGGFHERLIVENPTSAFLKNGGADDDWGRYLTLHDVERPNDRHRTDPDWLQKYQCVPWHYEERFHSDVFIGNSALNWIRNHRPDRPVFLQIGFTGPHEPWDPLPRHLDLYRDTVTPPCAIRPGELEEKPAQQAALRAYFADADGEARIDLSRANEADIAKMRRHYYAKITTVDEKIGEILDALSRCGYMDNSLLIFCSDHGDMLGDHGMAYKWLTYDPITHIPLIIRYPGSTRRGETVHDLVSLMDIGPTILEAADIPVPTYLEGRSLLPYTDRGTPKPRRYVFCEDNYQIMMRSQTRKMVYYIGQHEGEFYDLEADPLELWNRWDDPHYAAEKAECTVHLLEWFATSVYWTAGYKRDRVPQYAMRWPTETYRGLQGPLPEGSGAPPIRE